MKLLLLQARKKGDPAAVHERSAFARVLGIDTRHIVPWDLLAGPPPKSELTSADCILVGGSGDFSVSDAADQGWIRQFIDAAGDLTSMGVPVFASCFGFQAFVVGFGGRVETNKSNAEFGTFELTVSEAGARDDLFREVAPRFYAQFGHADHAAALPSIFVNLASSERNEYQAATIPGKDVYMTQFHPELSMEANRERAFMYLDSYAQAGFVDSFDDVMDNFRESPESSALLTRFVRGHLGPGATPKA